MHVLKSDRCREIQGGLVDAHGAPDQTSRPSLPASGGGSGGGQGGPAARSCPRRAPQCHAARHAALSGDTLRGGAQAGRRAAGCTRPCGWLEQHVWLPAASGRDALPIGATSAACPDDRSSRCRLCRRLSPQSALRPRCNAPGAASTGKGYAGEHKEMQAVCTASGEAATVAAERWQHQKPSFCCVPTLRKKVCCQTAHTTRCSGTAPGAAVGWGHC